MTKQLQNNNDISLEMSTNSMIDNEFKNLDKKYALEENTTFSIEAYESAKQLTKTILLDLKEYQKELPFPKIMLAGEKSFDVYWKTEKFKILINIQEDSELLHVFGRDLTKHNNPIDTKVNYELSILFITKWLKTIL